MAHSLRNLFTGHELSIRDVQRMNKETPDFWGWHDGMYIAGNDDFIAMRFLNGHQYEPVSRALWKKLCKDAFVADIGAHSGVFTLDAFKAGAKKVFTAEPHPINYSRLVMNVRHNGFPCEGLFYGAIGDSNRVDMLLVKSMTRCHAAGRVGLQNPNGEQFPVRVARLDSIIPKDLWPELKAVKIDAENLTPAVLRGMGAMLEHHPDLLIECIVPDMEEILKPYGYKFWKIWETGRIEEIEDLKPVNSTHNYNGTDEECRNRFASVRGLP